MFHFPNLLAILNTPVPLSPRKSPRIQWPHPAAATACRRLLPFIYFRQFRLFLRHPTDSSGPKEILLLSSHHHQHHQSITVQPLLFNNVNLCIAGGSPLAASLHSLPHPLFYRLSIWEGSWRLSVAVAPNRFLFCLVLNSGVLVAQIFLNGGCNARCLFNSVYLLLVLCCRSPPKHGHFLCFGPSIPIERYQSNIFC